VYALELACLIWDAGRGEDVQAHGRRTFYSKVMMVLLPPIRISLIWLTPSTFFE
jgi:hypothetical protein